MALKAAKRFVYVLVIGSVAFCTFYWYSSFSSKRQGPNIFMEGLTDYWRWECNSTSNMCQRHMWKYGDGGQSLRTCQMTCGPTPIWPQPNGEIVLSNQSVSFRYKDVYVLPINANDIGVRDTLSSVYRIFLNDIRSDHRLNPVDMKSDVKYLYISTHVVGNTSNIDFRLGTDESYKLVIQSINGIVRVSIKSATYFGARHALETLRQLIWYDDMYACLRVISYAKIVDTPTFSYRGLLLDTSSNYISVPVIKRTIDAMAVVKMNIFHWHMTGTTSFPLASQNMQHVVYGAFSSKKVYETTDVLDVINHARLRGIKVLVEVDNPGGIGRGWTWGHRKGVGDLSICQTNNSCQNFTHLNPNNQNTYKYLREIFLGLKNINGFTDVSHLGGTIDLQCWIDSQEVINMETYKRKGISGVLKYHQNMIYNIMSDIYKTEMPSMILWSDYFKQYTDFTKTIDSRLYIAQINSDSFLEDEKSLTDKGYRVIISHGNKWDLSRMPHWSTVYDHRPWEQLLWSQKEQVLGGEALVWTSLIDDRSLDNRVWPSAAAVAEVLWTDPQIESLSTATLRLQLLRERLVERGYFAASIAPKWCIQNPGACI